MGSAFSCGSSRAGAPLGPAASPAARCRRDCAATGPDAVAGLDRAGGTPEGATRAGRPRLPLNLADIGGVQAVEEDAVQPRPDSGGVPLRQPPPAGLAGAAQPRRDLAPPRLRAQHEEHASQRRAVRRARPSAFGLRRLGRRQRPRRRPRVAGNAERHDRSARRRRFCPEFLFHAYSRTRHGHAPPVGRIQPPTGRSGERRESSRASPWGARPSDRTSPGTRTGREAFPPQGVARRRVDHGRTAGVSTGMPPARDIRKTSRSTCSAEPNA